MQKKNNDKKLEIVVQTKDLAHALTFANSVVEKRNVLLELSNIKLCARGNLLEIGATDMDLYLNQEIGAEVISEGEITVSTQMLSEIIKKIQDSQIKIKQSTVGDRLEIIGKHCSFELLTLPVTQFPQMEDVDSEATLTVACVDFARIIEYTSFAMSTEETRYNLNGIYLHVKDNKEFCSAATDGHRLSVASILALNIQKDFGVIVPRKTVHELLKIIKDSKNTAGEISIFLGTNKAKFICNNIVLISKLIDGTFPDYSSFIPVDNQNKLTINTKLLASAVDRVATVTVDKFRSIKIIINESSLEITASGEAKGAANENLPFSTEKTEYCGFKGEDITIGFNPKYVSDIVSALREPIVNIYFKDAFSPILIKTDEHTGDSFVVMPVKV
jgi:DNA polymerase-3 subunit beta